jgi:hypothetical protein
MHEPGTASFCTASLTKAKEFRELGNGNMKWNKIIGSVCIWTLQGVPSCNRWVSADYSVGYIKQTIFYEQ